MKVSKRYHRSKGDLCTVCNKYPVRNKGNGKWGKTCKHCHSRPYLQFRKTFCEECGFIPKYICQLEIYHVDGNKLNNKIINLRTLCANCHRLISYEQSLRRAAA
jgi:hypothetical protein